MPRRQRAITAINPASRISQREPTEACGLRNVALSFGPWPAASASGQNTLTGYPTGGSVGGGDERGVTSEFRVLCRDIDRVHTPGPEGRGVGTARPDAALPCGLITATRSRTRSEGIAAGAAGRLHFL